MNRNLMLVALAMVDIAGYSAPLAQAAPAQTLAPAFDPDPEDAEVPEEAEPTNPANEAAPYVTCQPIRVDLGVTHAGVQVKNTSCKFGRDFVRRNRFTLCNGDPTIKGWKKTFSGSGEAITLTLSKGSKRIRTGACGSL